MRASNTFQFSCYFTDICSSVELLKAQQFHLEKTINFPTKFKVKRAEEEELIRLCKDEKGTMSPAYNLKKKNNEKFLEKSRVKSLDFSANRKLRKLFHYECEHGFLPLTGPNGAENTFLSSSQQSGKKLFW